MASIIKVNEIQDAGSNTIISSDGSGTFTPSSSLATGVLANTPAFEVHLSADQTLTDDTLTKIQWDTVVFDTNSAYDNTTNYRFTVPTGLGGKYLVYAQGQCIGDGTTGEVQDTNMQIRKNGTSITRTIFGGDTSATADRNTFLSTFTVLDLSAGDYLELYALINSISGTATFRAFFGSAQIMSRFGAYRLIGV